MIIEKTIGVVGREHTKKFFDFLSEQNPDYIITTHFAPAHLVQYWKKKYQKKTPLGVVVTDYGMHHAWFSGQETDYFVATKEMADALTKNGAKDVMVSGIPVDPVFYEAQDVNELKLRYPIPKNTPVVLVMAGGEGMARIDTLVQTLLAQKIPTVIIAIAGNNPKLVALLNALSVPRSHALQVVGWTDAVHEYMQMADLVISKPGGMTVSECLALGKPLLAIHPIPGQEEENARFITEHGAGMVIQNLSELPTAVMEMLAQTQNTNISKKRTPAARVILDLISKRLTEASHTR